MSDPTQPEPQKIDSTRPVSKIFDPDRNGSLHKMMTHIGYE